MADGMRWFVEVQSHEVRPLRGVSPRRAFRSKVRLGPTVVATAFGMRIAGSKAASRMAIQATSPAITITVIPRTSH